TARPRLTNGIVHAFWEVRMRHLGSVLTTFVMLAANISTVSGATSDDLASCAKESGAPAIAACSRLIESRTLAGQPLAAVYNNRGFEDRTKGDLDRAIADYNEAIRADPERAEPYNNRGRVHHVKGDLDRAIADFNEAIRL